MKRTVFKGAGCAIVTPMHNDGTINYEEFGRLIEFQLEGGTDAIVVMGTTGEASTHYDVDHLKAVEYTVDTVNGRVPVVAGCGSNHTHHAVKLSVESQKLGADGLLHVTPYYNKTSQQGLVLHFNAIADAVDIPVILYNVPSRTGMSIAPSTYQQLAKHENIVGTKEASGDISLIARIVEQCGEDFDIYSGNDDQIFPILAYGGMGVISVLGNVIPREIHQLCQHFFDGDIAASRQLQLDILGLNDAMFCEVNPIPVKEALNQMGFAAGGYQLPLCEPSSASRQLIAAALASMGVRGVGNA